jgi:hypothetical protein
LCRLEGSRYSREGSWYLKTLSTAVKAIRTASNDLDTDFKALITAVKVFAQLPRLLSTAIRGLTPILQDLKDGWQGPTYSPAGLNTAYTALSKAFTVHTTAFRGLGKADQALRITLKREVQNLPSRL